MNKINTPKNLHEPLIETPPVFPVIHWHEGEIEYSACWRSAAGASPPRRIIAVDDRITANTVYVLVCEGSGLLWRGDYHNARQLLSAIARRIEKQPRKEATTDRETFGRFRQARSQTARPLNMLLLPLDADYRIPLRRAPDVSRACQDLYGCGKEPSVVSLREILGLIGAREWRTKGVLIPALGERIYPYYGAFSPIRGEYVDLVAQAPLPTRVKMAFDIGTGTGVLAAVLTKRGVGRIVATDLSSRALECARDNLRRLGYCRRVEIVEADLFPKGKAKLIVCNPPWIPAKPSIPLERAIFDKGSRMLRGFLSGLTDHLFPEGEGWLILSDLAEHLGLRTREELSSWFAEAGLKVVGRLDTKPRPPKANNPRDPLHSAKSREITSLWRVIVQ